VNKDGLSRRSALAGSLLVMASAACGKIGAPDTFDHGRDVRDFGAIGDGVADDTAAFQRAIDEAGRAGGGVVAFGPGTYLLRYRPAEDGDGLSALTMRSGVTLEGSDRERCVLKLADGQIGPGTYARTITSRGEISRAKLHRFSIDGNRAGQGSQRDDINGGAVLLGWKGRCLDVVVEDLHVRNAIGQGIMLLGTIGTLSRNLRIVGNRVERSSFIGIQCSQFDGVTIQDNAVSDCRDNGIDVYGDDTNGHSPIATSHNARIAGNDIQRCSVGVFLETVADSVALNNNIVNCTSAGVRVNRIHGEPRNLTIADNRITDTPTGVAMGGDTGGVIIRGNDVRGFTTAGIEFGYNVSRVTATDNRFVPATRSTPIVLGTPTVLGSKPEEMLSFIRISNNRIPAGHNSARLFVNRYRRLNGVDIGQFVKALN